MRVIGETGGLGAGVDWTVGARREAEHGLAWLNVVRGVVAAFIAGDLDPAVEAHRTEGGVPADDENLECKIGVVVDTVTDAALGFFQLRTPASKISKSISFF